MADGMNGLLIGLSIFWTACLLHMRHRNCSLT